MPSKTEFDVGQARDDKKKIERTQGRNKELAYRVMRLTPAISALCLGKMAGKAKKLPWNTTWKSTKKPLPSNFSKAMGEGGSGKLRLSEDGATLLVRGKGVEELQEHLDKYFLKAFGVPFDWIVENTGSYELGENEGDSDDDDAAEGDTPPEEEEPPAPFADQPLTRIVAEQQSTRAVSDILGSLPSVSDELKPALQEYLSEQLLLYFAEAMEGRPDEQAREAVFKQCGNLLLKLPLAPTGCRILLREQEINLPDDPAGMDQGRVLAVEEVGEGASTRDEVMQAFYEEVGAVAETMLLNFDLNGKNSERLTKYVEKFWNVSASGEEYLEQCRVMRKKISDMLDLKPGLNGEISCKPKALAALLGIDDDKYGSHEEAVTALVGRARSSWTENLSAYESYLEDYRNKLEKRWPIELHQGEWTDMNRLRDNLRERTKNFQEEIAALGSVDRSKKGQRVKEIVNDTIKYVQSAPIALHVDKAAPTMGVAGGGTSIALRGLQKVGAMVASLAA